MRRHLFAVLSLAIACQTPLQAQQTEDPELVRLGREKALAEAESAALKAQLAAIEARFGVAATAMQGTIGSPEKFSALGQWTLARATASAAQAVFDAVKPKLAEQCKDGTILVTSAEDRRAAALQAEVVGKWLDSFAERLAEAQPKNDVAMFAVTGSAAAIRGLVGTADSLVALLRADYAFADLGIQASDVALRLAVANLLLEQGASPEVRIDGVASPGAEPALLGRYQKFFDVWKAAQSVYAAASEEQQKKLTRLKALLDAAAAFDTELLKPVAGQVPLVQLALAAENSGRGQCVVFVKFGPYSASVMTRKQLLSRNDELTAIAGGVVQYALFDSTGRLLQAKLLPLDERLSAKLSRIAGSADKID